METKESLLAKNKVFDRDHGLRDSHLELCNYLIGVIESTRSDKEPRAGDRIECIGPNAEYRFRTELWPDYTEQMLLEDLKEFIKRNRRKGG